MKKILIATDGFLPRWDGISSFLNELIPRLDHDYKITVIAPNMGELVSKYKANIIRFNTLKIRLADNYYLAILNPKIISEEVKKADIVWVQCLGTIGMAGILAAKRYNKPVIMYNHMIEWEVFPNSQGIDLFKIPINMIVKFFGKLFYNMCNLLIVPSSEHAELLSHLRVKAEKRVVHLGVDVNLYKPAKDKEKAKTDIGIDPRKLVIGYGGRVSLEKDLKTLYRAFIRISKTYDNCVLLIAGGGRPELEKMFRGKENVILTGVKDNLAPYYQAMDIYVLPSIVETTSLTTMEAMSCSVAVIATPVGFIREYIEDGINGLIFPKKNSYTLYTKIKYLIDNPKDRENMGKKARETIVENYTWDKTSAGIKQILESLMPINNR
ncbi:MAG: glycosyltransferase family 4 protein [Nanoarchaeota archaeon]